MGRKFEILRGRIKKSIENGKGARMEGKKISKINDQNQNVKRKLKRPWNIIRVGNITINNKVHFELNS